MNFKINPFRILTILIFLGFSSSFAQKKSAQPLPQPKLVVGIVIDQMRYDFIYRFWNKFGEGGFKRLVSEGFFCRNTNYNYMPTFTGPGHSSVYTGTTPSVHGIISNNWYVPATKKIIYCASDPKVRSIGGDSLAGKMSPRNLLTTTITDELRMSDQMKSKVIGVALKDRSAILPAGHTANGAYWFDDVSGNWITSSYYMNALPQWVNDFNAQHDAQKYLATAWTTLLPIDQYTESMDDDNIYETPLSGETKPVFPHDLPTLAKASGTGLIRETPFGNSLTTDFALQTIQSENMGKTDYTDFLAVSFSSTDYVGHQFGPYSKEIEDTYLRLDKELARLLSFLDTYLGKDKVLVFLTADHAVEDVPAHLMSMNIPAGYFDAQTAIDSLSKKLHAVYGDSLIMNYSNQQIFLNHQTIEKKKLDLRQVEQFIAAFMLRFKGMSAAYAALDLQNNSLNNDFETLVENGYNAERSGDVLLNLQPGWMEFAHTGTTHGSPYPYDTHVPLLWYGWKIPTGSSSSPVNITDIAATLAMLLNIQFPDGCTGKPIQELTK